MIYGWAARRYAEPVQRQYLTERGWPTPRVFTELTAAFQMAKLRLPIPEAQYRIAGWRFDFAWPAAHVVLEVDGWHHDRPDVMLKDAQKTRALCRLGWLVLRMDPDADEWLDHLVTIAHFVSMSHEYARTGGGRNR